MPYIHVITLFVMGAAKSFPVWAERQRYEPLGSLSMNTPVTVLEGLVTDLLDADRARSKTAKLSGSELIKGKGGKGKKCKHCHQEDLRQYKKDCLAVNAEKRKEWEDKTGKKWVPYDQYVKKKKSEGKDKKPRKGKKPEGSDDDDDQPTNILMNPSIL